MSNIFSNFAQHSLAFRKQEIIVFVKEDHNGRRLLFALKMINLSYNYRQFMAMDHGTYYTMRPPPLQLLVIFTSSRVQWWWMLYHHYRDLRDKWAFPCTTTTQHHRSMHHWTTEWMGQALSSLQPSSSSAQSPPSPSSLDLSWHCAIILLCTRLYASLVHLFENPISHTSYENCPRQQFIRDPWLNA